jgi:protein ImuA
MTCQTPALDQSSRQTLIRTLAEKMRQCRTARHSDAKAISTGYGVLDRALGGGVHCGTLVEWIASEGGVGATTLALAAAKEACREAGALLVIDRRRTFYPLAAAACGIDLSRLLLVRPQHDRDETWAIDQALRSGGASAVLAWPEKLDDHLFRRLQLAAEAGGTLGLFLRPLRALAEPSWAEVRFLVDPQPSAPSSNGAATRRTKVSLLRSSGGAAIHCPQFVVGLDDRSGYGIEGQRISRVRRQKIA